METRSPEELQLWKEKKMRRKKEIEIKETKRIGIFGGVSGGLGILGLHNVCHAACEGLIVFLAVFGIALTGMPLLFLQDYSLFFSIMGIASATFAISYYLWKKKTCRMAFNKRQNFWFVFNILVFMISIFTLYTNISQSTGGLT